MAKWGIGDFAGMNIDDLGPTPLDQDSVETTFQESWNVDTNETRWPYLLFCLFMLHIDFEI